VFVVTEYKLTPEHLGGGTVIFRNALMVAQHEVLAYVDGLVEDAVASSYTIVNGADGMPKHAINKGGFIYDLDKIHKAPARIIQLDHPFFIECERVIYRALMHYIEMFPAVLQCLWWKSSGHVLRYSTGGSLGFHADNDVNYRYGHEPREQQATRNVLSALVYFNDSTDDVLIENSFSGGHMTVPYFDVDIAPSTGTVVLMPANYIGAHEIHEVTRGRRYSYLTWFAQGSADSERGINPSHSDSPATTSHGQWWLSSLISDFSAHLTDKYGSVDASPNNVRAFMERPNDH